MMSNLAFSALSRFQEDFQIVSLPAFLIPPREIRMPSFFGSLFNPCCPADFPRGDVVALTIGLYIITFIPRE